MKKRDHLINQKTALVCKLSLRQSDCQKIMLADEEQNSQSFLVAKNRTLPAP